MTKIETSRLRQLAARELAHLRREALEKGFVDPEGFERVERLQQLLELTQRPELVKRGWTAGALFAGSAVIVFSLLMLRMPSTEVVLTARCHAVKFDPPGGSLLNVDLPARRVESFEPSRLEFSRSIASTHKPLQSRAFDRLVLECLPEKGDLRGGTMRIGDLHLGAGQASVRVSLEPPAVELVLSVETDGTHPRVEVDFVGRVAVRSESLEEAVELETRVPRQVRLESASETLTVAARLHTGGELTTWPGIPCSGVKFSETLLQTQPNRTWLRKFSHLLSGHMVLPEIDNRRVELPPRSHLVIGDGDGELQVLGQGEKGTIDVVWRGTAGQIELNGTDTSPRVLEFLLSNHMIGSLWAATIGLFGLVWGLVQFLRKK